MPALFFAIVAAMYFLYMLLARAALRRFTWERRSIVLGEENWYMTPVLCLIGLALPVVAGLIFFSIIRTVFFPMFAPAGNGPVAPPLLAIHILCIAVIVSTALRAQGHPFRLLLPSNRRLVLKWIALPSLISLAIATVITLAGTSALPGAFGFVFIGLFISGMINASVTAQQSARSKKVVGYTLEDTPLNNEIRTIFWPGPMVGTVRLLPRPERAAERKAAASSKQSPIKPPTDFEQKIRRRLRWSRARAGPIDRTAILPIEYLHDNDTLTITAPLALRFLGWDRGYLRWRAAASPGEPDRTPARFVSAIAQLDYYTLSHSNTPDQFFEAYRKRVPIHIFLWEHAGAEKLDVCWAEIKAAIKADS